MFNPLSLLRKRDYGLSAAVGTALVARAAGLLINIIAIPIALHALGTVRFGVFLVILGIIQALSISGLGMPQSIARTIAMEHLSPKVIQHRIGLAITTSFLSSSISALFATLGLYWWMSSVAELEEHFADLSISLLLFFFIVIIQTTLQVFEGVQSGLLRNWVTNTTRLCSSTFALIAIFILLRYLDSIWAMLICINGGIILGLLVNYANVPRAYRHFWKYLVAKTNLKLLIINCKIGLSFIFIQGVSLIFLNIPVFLIALKFGAAGSVDFGLHMRALVLMWSVLAMIGNPIWPAMLTSISRGELKTTFKMIYITASLAGAIILLFSVTFYLHGSNIFQLWAGRTIDPNGVWEVFFPISIICILSLQFGNSLLIGLGMEKHAAISNFVFAASSIGLGMIITDSLGPSGFFIGVVISGLLILAVNTYKICCAVISLRGAVV